ncbi:hypothetical protein [Aliikangiella coralliicola]|uniref:HEAT repeat domain-containing protein n=1 Tax=Aliikangiella coralliicola TaxID=2592383 RepID=A0A545UF03_9GAMM|nr:hypothetical protein [Aliikangiella coralliicola]TQV88038.1 hypothetical protein FLL46_09525 [Aliikangiella coralliicola]
MKISMKKILITLSALMVSISTMAQELVSVEEFVGKTYFHGLPYEQAIQYDATYVPQLKAILNDYSQSELWPNTIVMLEIIGSKQDLDDIISFIESEPAGEYSIAHERAKNAAIYGLGYFINHTKSKKALNYLVESLQENSWVKRDVRGLGRLHKTESERNADFSKYAMLGLALSGESEAILGIKQFKANNASKTLNSRVSESRRDKINRAAEVALEEGEKIRKQGLREYYKSQHQHDEHLEH